MAKIAYRVRNWKDYNKSLVQRGSLTFWFSEEVIQEWQNGVEENAHGNRKYSDPMVIGGLTIRQIFRLPLRATEGFLNSVMKMMKLEISVPDYTTLCRRSRDLKIPLGARATEKTRHVLVDSTGVQVMGESEWKHYKYKLNRSRCQVWRKLHIAMDANNQDILSATVTESVRLDGNYLSGLIDEIADPISQITGDGAYDKKSCYRKAYERNAKAVFPPQHNACVQRNKYKRDRALEARDKTIISIGRGEGRDLRLKEWKKENHYHQRSLVESMMFRMKSIFGDQIRSRTIENQRTDLLIRCYAINRINLLGLPVSRPT
jgi:Transposase DDE domain